MIRDLIKLMRPTEWTKNVFVLPAAVFSLPRLMAGGEDPGAVLLPVVASTLAAVAAFSLLSSGFYCVNDAIDAPRDREHPVKRHRPVAAGRVPASIAIIFGIIAGTIGLALGFIADPALGLVLLTYALLQVLYNIFLKHVKLVDVTALAIGFSLRAAAGATAIDVKVSIWLILCVFFLCLFLGFVKRLCDMTSAEAAPNSTWRSSAGYDSRDELSWLLGVTATLAIVTYVMYTLSNQTWDLFGHRSIGFAILTPLVVIAIHRFYSRATEGDSDSPLAALRHDRVVLATVVLFAIGLLVTLFVPEVEGALESLFYIAGDQP